MISEDMYDSYCVYPSCVKFKRSFFIYDKQSIHVQEHTKFIRVIHPHQISQTIYPLFNKRNELFTRSKKILDEKVNSQIENFCQKICVFMKKVHLNSYFNLVNKYMGPLEHHSQNHIYNKLKEGSYEMLKHILKTDGQQQINRKQKIIQESIGNNLQNLQKVFQKEFLATLKHREDQNIFSGDIQKQLKRVLSKNMTEDNSFDSKERLSIHLDRRKQKSEEDSLMYDKKMVKRKIIHKSQIEKKLCSKPIQGRGSQHVVPLIASLDLDNGISDMDSGEIKVKGCKNADKTFQLISSKYKTLKGIHIFHHSFATKQVLKKIFARYPTLKNISLNCNHQFQFKDITQFPKQFTSTIENLQLKWDLNNFFAEYHLSKYFPNKPRQEMQRQSNVNICLKQFMELKFNKSLTLTSQRNVDYLIQTKNSLANIQSLHYSKVMDDLKMSAMRKLILLCKMGLTNLLTLSLSQVSLINTDQLFKQLIKMNVNLRTVSIYYCQITQINIRSLFRSLLPLKNLTNLLFECKSQYKDKLWKIKPKWISHHYNLEQLCLINMEFIGDYEGEKDPNMSILSKLRKLTHLNLNTCVPVSSNILRQLKPHILGQLQSLNLGLTDIDNEIMSQFWHMKNLKFLDLDQTKVTGQAFVNACKEFKDKNKKYPPLESINIQQGQQGSLFEVKDLKEMGRYLPSLRYIEIGNNKIYAVHCKGLRDYNFAQFEVLKTIAMDEQLNKLMNNIDPKIQRFVIVQKAYQ